MVLRKVLVEVVRADELQDGVAQKLQPLVGAQGEVGLAQGAVGEGAGQQTDVGELYAGGVFELGQFLK